MHRSSRAEDWRMDKISTAGRVTASVALPLALVAQPAELEAR